MTERHTISAQRARAVAAIDADIYHRQLRAQKFMELRAETELTHPQIWKQLELDEDLLEAERAARVAAADDRCGWWLIYHQDDIDPAPPRAPWWLRLFLPEPQRLETE